MAYKIVVQPTEEPVSLDEAKAHCRVDIPDEDSMIEALIVTARGMAEHETGRALCTQTRELVLNAFPEDFVLRGAPIQSLVSVKYIDTAGIEQTLDADFTLLDKDSEPGYLLVGFGKTWPATRAVPNAVRVRYVCGYGSADEVPKPIKQWIKLAIGTMYEHRETIIAGQGFSLPDDFWPSLLDRFRLEEVA